MKIIYEPHPVSPERKAELRAQDYKILDARFAPEGYQHPDAGKTSAKKSKARADKHDSEAEQTSAPAADSEVDQQQEEA